MVQSRFYFIAFFSLLIFSLQAQKNVGSFVSTAQMIEEGYRYFDVEIQLFDPEKDFTERGKNTFIPVASKQYQKGNVTVVCVENKVINNIIDLATNHTTQSRADYCVDNPSANKFWGSGSFENAVNAAIEAERIEFNNTDIADYVHPPYSDLIELNVNVIEALRTAYSAGYADLNELTIESDLTLLDITQNFTCLMDLCDEWNHESSCLGTFSGRINAGLGTNFCWTTASENIAATFGMSSSENAVLASLFFMMYTDVDCCANSHRKAMLDCDYNENTKLGFGYHETIDGLPYDQVMAWDFITLNYNSGCTWDTPIGTPVCSQLLPLDLISFEIQKSDCHNAFIEWITENEINIDRFEIYNSTGDLPFEKIGTVKAQNKNSRNEYFLKADIANIKNGYFRLKWIDFDGYENFSDPIQFYNSCASDAFDIIPNPASQYFKLTNQENIKSLTLYNLQGYLVCDLDIREINHPIHDLEPGIYLLHIQTPSGMTYKKVLIGQ